MAVFKNRSNEFQQLFTSIDSIKENIQDYAKDTEVVELENLKKTLQRKMEDFYCENRKLNIGVVGQVKAGKSSFLNTLLFGGREILPKASTPKTATLTKMEYSEENIIQVEYYSEEEWQVLEENAEANLENEISTSAREIIEMVRRNGEDPKPYLAKRMDTIKFDTYDDLIFNLNDYVGEDGRFTPFVKAVTLSLNKEEFKELSIVDTPGLNDPIASRTLRTKEFMEVCDVVFFLSQSGSFLDKSDWTLLSSQLPQKGVKKLVLIGSKYDSGIRDILRVKEEDDDFDDEDNTANNIPKACKIINKKLKKRAKMKVQEFIKDLEQRGGTPELINVVKQCSEPILISSIAYNMVNKPEEEYTPEERNIWSALCQFSDDMQSDLRLLGNFEKINDIFKEVVLEKEEILQKKEKSLFPDSKGQVLNLLKGFLEKTEKRLQVLEENDKEQLLEQRKQMEGQMGAIKADIATVFGELNSKLELEKSEAIREIRSDSKDYLSIQDRSGTRTVRDSYTVSDSKWWNPFSWGKSHVEYYTYEEQYSYCISADAIENLKKYSISASNRVEHIFGEIISIKQMKRKLIDVVVKNFDMGNENYDSSLFKVMVEDNVSKIQFPVFDMDISDAMNSIAGKFTGEITSAEQKTELSQALSHAISNIYTELARKLEQTVKKFKEEMLEMSGEFQEKILNNISKEFELLLAQCERKEEEIKSYSDYVNVLNEQMKNL